MELFKTTILVATVVIVYVYLFFLIKKLPKPIAITFYIIVIAALVAIIIMSVWYPDNLKLLMDFLNIGIVLFYK